MKLTDGRQAPGAPTWHYWMLVLLLLPGAGTVLVFAGEANGVSYGLTVPGIAAVTGVLLAYERAVRRMPPGRRIAWAVVGGVLAAALAAAASLALLVILVLSW